MSKKVFLKGTLILACTGLISRLAGFFYRIFLSHSIGAEGMGLYQLALPIQGLMAALSYAGIQSALSRLISAKLTLHRKKDARFSVPVCAIHACIDSYYYARKKAIVPAAVQLTEQAVRIGASYVLYLICLRESRPVTALIAAGGSLAGEIAASLVSLLAITFYFGNCHFSETDVRTCRTFSLAKEIFGLSFPISLNRILLTLLGSIEVVLIPQMLLRFGLTASDSLQIYGIFTGMALPLILFPSTLTASASVMLMPSVAELDTLGDRKKIQKVIDQTFFLCMLLGFLCGAAFFLMGPFLGRLLFHSPTAGTYIRYMAFVCPFLYTNTMLASILHGLGRPGRCLVHNISGILIRIFFVTAVIPVIGIRGYFYGIFLGELLLSLLHVKALKFPYRQSDNNRL